MKAIESIPGSVTIMAQTEGYYFSAKPFSAPLWTREALDRTALALSRRLVVTESGVILAGQPVSEEGTASRSFDWREWMINNRGEMDRISADFVNILDLQPVGRRYASGSLVVNRHEMLLSPAPVWVKADFSIELRRADSPNDMPISLGLAPADVMLPQPEPARISPAMRFKTIFGTVLDYPKAKVIFLRTFLEDAGRAFNKAYAIDRSLRDIPLIVKGTYDHDQVIAVLGAFTDIKRPGFIVRNNSDLKLSGTQAVDALVAALERQATPERRRLIETLRRRSRWTIQEVAELSPILAQSLKSRFYERMVSEWGNTPVTVTVSAQILVGPVGDLQPITFSPRPSK
jgi:hypothetical protein